MTNPDAPLKRVLAIDPSSRGFGYVVMESPNRLVEWGLKEAMDNKNARCLRQIAGLVKLYEPDLIAVEEIGKNSRRYHRVQDLILGIHELGAEHNVKTRAVSKHDLRETFQPEGATSKESIARALAKRFPELELKLPPPRKTWEGPDPRMAMFNAAAMAVAVLEGKRRVKPQAGRPDTGHRRAPSRP